MSMNIYVDKMPKSCGRCPCNDDYYRCGLSGDLFGVHDIDTGRMKNCKLKKLADVVEVVRCADCKWFNPINNGDHGYCGTPFHGAEVYEDDYCSDGERKTDDEC